MHYRTYIQHTPASLALVDWIESIYNGWDVDFSHDPHTHTPLSGEGLEKSGAKMTPLLSEDLDKGGLGVRRLSVPASRLVVCNNNTTLPLYTSCLSTEL